MIDMFYNILYRVGIKSNQDKVLHGLVGFAIGSMSMVLFGALSILIVSLAALGKEFYDLYIKKTEFGFFDMFATFVGGWIGIILIGLLGA